MTGCYVYCIAPAAEELSLGEIGIDNRAVYTVVHNGIGALVHECLAGPYQPDDSEVATAWVLAHHRVVEVAWRRWGTVLPMAFNTIIKADQGDARRGLKSWLETEHGSLNEKLDALTGKAEYGVQVSWDPIAVARKVAEISPEISKLEEEIRSKPRGLAYMYRQKLEGLLKKEMETRAAKEFEELYGRLSQCADKIRVEKVKGGGEGRQMLMNLSCLVSTEKYPALEAELCKVSHKDGHFVRLVGPLPPYSFC